MDEIDYILLRHPEKYSILQCMKKFVIQQYKLNVEKSEPGSGTLRFVFLTDLHNVSLGQDNEVLLRAIDRIKPGAVLCGGDMVVGKPGHSVEAAQSFLLRLVKNYPVYHATGNHEYRLRIYPEVYGDMYESYKHPLEKEGIIFLENEKRLFQIGGMTAVIYGYDMRRWYYERFKRRKLPVSEMNEHLGHPDPNNITILLAHNPVQMDTYVEWGADITLCGHYHGGIMRFGAHHGLVSPDFRLFPGNVHGLFQRGKQSVIVGAGLGEHTLPLRIHNPRELVVLEITSK